MGRGRGKGGARQARSSPCGWEHPRDPGTGILPSASLLLVIGALPHVQISRVRREAVFTCSVFAWGATLFRVKAGPRPRRFATVSGDWSLPRDLPPPLINERPVSSAIGVGCLRAPHERLKTTLQIIAKSTFRLRKDLSEPLNAENLIYNTR